MVEKLSNFRDKIIFFKFALRIVEGNSFTNLIIHTNISHPMFLANNYKLSENISEVVLTLLNVKKV